jgi:hypothetical protein
MNRRFNFQLDSGRPPPETRAKEAAASSTIDEISYFVESAARRTLFLSRIVPFMATSSTAKSGFIRQSARRVFVSYARKDGADTAQHLRRALEAADCEVWVDTERIPGGASWSKEIEHALECRCFNDQIVRDSDGVLSMLQHPTEKSIIVPQSCPAQTNLRRERPLLRARPRLRSAGGYARLKSPAG